MRKLAPTSSMGTLARSYRYAIGGTWTVSIAWGAGHEYGPTTGRYCQNADAKNKGILFMGCSVIELKRRVTYDTFTGISRQPYIGLWSIHFRTGKRPNASPAA